MLANNSNAVGVLGDPGHMKETAQESLWTARECARYMGKVYMLDKNEI